MTRDKDYIAIAQPCIPVTLNETEIGQRRQGAKPAIHALARAIGRCVRSR